MACNNNCNCNCNCIPVDPNVCELKISQQRLLGRALTCDEFAANTDALEIIRACVCDLKENESSAACIATNAPLTYFWEPFCLFIDNVEGEDQFTVPTGSENPTATVKCIKVSQNGVTLPPTSTTISSILGNGFASAVSSANVVIQLDNPVGDPGAPCSIYVEGFVRKTLEQLSGCTA